MKKIITVILSALFLTACVQSTATEMQMLGKIIFVGESEHWEAEFVYDISETSGEKNGKKYHSNEDQYTLTFTYKGDKSDLATIKQISYSFDTVSASGSNTEKFTATEPNKKSVFKLSGASKNSARILSDHVITATVQWDDFEETFELNIAPVHTSILQ